MAKKTDKQSNKIIRDFDGAKKIIDLINDVSNKLNVYTSIIKAHIEAGNLDIAEDVSIESLCLIRQWNTKKPIFDYSDYSKDYHIDLIFRQFPEFKDKKLAVEIIREYEATIEKIKDLRFCCLEYIKCAERAYCLGETKLAEEILEKSEKNAHNIRHDKRKTVVLINIARLWTKKGNRKKAEAILQSAIDIAEKLKTPNEILLEIAVLYVETGNLQRGMELIKYVSGGRVAYLDEPIIYRQFPKLIKAGFKKEVASIIELFNNKKTVKRERIIRDFLLSQAYWEAGESDSSFQIIDKIIKENDITKESFPFYLLFDSLLEQDKFDEAEKILNETKQLGDYPVSFLFDLAKCHFERGKKLEAKRLIERAKNAAEKIENANDQYECFLCVAACWARFGDKEAACKTFEKASKLHWDRKEKCLETTVEIGFYQWYFGFLEDAKKSAQKALEQARNMPTNRVLYYSGVVDLLLRLNDTKNACDLFDEVIKIAEMKGNEKILDNHLMNFANGLVCQKNDHQYSEPMKVMTIQEQ
ncbi:MAG: hypothetical protein LBL62_07630 [Planctomycetaceae bacterium]|jgi:tetratricopeptide (TPR) repeat protein|nr:hypothetical protein [Planctomycetaceae bacterium]